MEKNVYTSNPGKILDQSKVIKKKQKGPNCYDQSLNSGCGTGHEALPPTNFEIFLIFPSFLSRLKNREAIHIQSLLY